MYERTTQKTVAILYRLGSLLGAGLRWLIIALGSIDYASRKTYYYIGGALVLLLAAFIGYRLLFPTVVLEKGDHTLFGSMAEYEDYVKQHPLVLKQEPSGRKFHISSTIREDKQAVYTIELQSRPIKPEMSDAYIQSYLAVLEASQQDALDWIRSQGQNPDKLAIIWRPDPAERRSRLLGETTKPAPNKSQAPSAPLTPTPTPQPTTQPKAPTTPTPLFPH